MQTLPPQAIIVEPSIDTSYQVSVQLVMQGSRILEIDQQQLHVAAMFAN
jgi:hypothetical protein